jgi:hypothetical protein
VENQSHVVSKGRVNITAPVVPGTLETGINIILRHEGKCIFGLEDLAAATSTTRPDQWLTLELWRLHGTQPVSVHGGKLGISVTQF